MLFQVLTTACLTGAEETASPAGHPENRLSVFTRGYGPFACQKWIADPATGICMSLEGSKEAFLDGYNVRFHSLKNRYPTDKFHAGWRGEFFCEPDDVILVSEVGPEGCSAAAPIFCRNSKWDKDFCRKLVPGSAEGHRHPEVTPLSPLVSLHPAQARLAISGVSAAAIPSK